MSAAQSAYDLFLSYARKDNAPIPATFPRGWVTAIRDHILADHRQFSTAPLRIFFDTQEIKDADDWRHRILGALRQSKMLLVCLSPNYFSSPYCRWEWEEYLTRQVHQLMGSESIATIYFVEAPGSDEQANAKWLADLMRGNFTDLRPWFPEGAEALRKEEVARRMARLGETLWERLQRARRAEAVPGNLRWQNPRFVGRRDELRKLHEQLGTGAVGVVTAVQGLGGQGKTELAVAYAHGFADSYPAGLWSLAAEGKKELLPLIGELAWERALGFTPTEQEKNDPALLGRGVLEHLRQLAKAVTERIKAEAGELESALAKEKSKPLPDDILVEQLENRLKTHRAMLDRGAATLLLLDNVSEPALLSPAQLATLPGGLGAGWLRIVATTRLDVRAQKDRLAVLAVDALDEASALSLIRDHQPFRDAQGRPVTDPELSVPRGVPSFAGEAEENAAREIVRALGGFTLAVEQVALYLGLHPDVTPAAFLATLRERGLPAADALPQRDADVAAQMLTQSKQLGLILEATLARLDAPARTALQFAALLPPDTVPWPWLRALTTTAFESPFGVPPSGGPVFGVPPSGGGATEPPEGGTPNQAPNPLTQRDEFGADPWLAVQRRLTGLRLLTPGDHPEVARIHRLVAAHLERSAEHRSAGVVSGGPQAEQCSALQAPAEGQRPGTMPAQGNALGSSPPNEPSPEGAAQITAVHRHVGNRAFAVDADPRSPEEWELTALLIAIPIFLAGDSTNEHVAGGAINLSDKVRSYRSLGEAASLIHTATAVYQRLAASDPANAAWQRDLSVSLNKLGDLAVAQGDLAGALRSFTECHDILKRLAASDPANAAWQRDLSVSLVKLGDLAVAQGDLAGALRSFTASQAIRERLAASDPANVAWQRDLSVSLNKLGDLAVAQGDLAGALRSFTASQAIRERLAASDPANAAWQRDLSVSLNKLGDLAVAQGDLAGALRSFTESQTIRERLAASDPANAEWQRDLIGSHVNVGGTLASLGDHTSALREVRTAQELAGRLRIRFPDNADFQLAVHHANGAYFRVQSTWLPVRMGLLATAVPLVWGAMKLLKVSAWFVFASVPMLLFALVIGVVLLAPWISKSRLIRQNQVRVEAGVKRMLRG